MKYVLFAVAAALALTQAVPELRAQAISGSGIGSSVGVGTGSSLGGSSGITSSIGVSTGSSAIGGDTSLFGNTLGIGAEANRIGGGVVYGTTGSGGGLGTGSSSAQASAPRDLAGALNSRDRSQESWRYRLQNGRWYYRMPDNRWLVWSGSSWAPAPSTTPAPAPTEGTMLAQQGPVPYTTGYGSYSLTAAPGANAYRNYPPPGIETGTAWVDPRAGYLYGWGYGPGATVMRAESGLQVGY